MDIQKRLAHPKTVVIIVLALIVILVLLFQKEERLSKLFKHVRPDHLSVLYLQLLLEMDPEKTELRITLADQLSKLGQLDKAKHMLEPLLLEKGNNAVRAQLLSVEIDMKKYFAIDPQHPLRELELSKLKNKMLAIASKDIPADILPKAIEISLALNLPAIAAELYVIRASFDIENYAKWLKEAGRWYIASGQPLQASQIFKNAFDTSIEPELAFDFALLSIDALRKADHPEKALELIEHYLEKFPQDITLLDEAIALAQEVNKPNQAIRWGTLRLALNSDDLEQIEKQIDLALSSNDLALALHLCEHLINLRPDDTAIRLRTAQIAEWANKPEIALTHWHWLARNEGDKASIDNTLRLAKSLFRGAVVVEMFHFKSKKQPLTQSEIRQLAQAYGQANPNKLITILADYLAQHPSDYATWELLAKLQVDSGHLDDAIITWRNIITRFGNTADNVTQLAKLLWKQWKPKEALAVLKNNIDKATNKDYEFWSLLGDIAWQFEQTKTAFHSYQVLWKSDQPNEFVASRLIQLANDMKHFSEAISVAEQGYWKFKQPRWLILAMNASVLGGKWKELERLLRLSKKNIQLFAQQETYWLLRAQLATHKHQFNNALTFYTKAIAVNPHSIVAKSGLLWSLINAHKIRPLAYYIHKWSKEAESQPLLWSAFAAGFVKLDQPENALIWFKRHAIRHPNDYLWLLSFADALDRSHQTDAALRLRRYIFANLNVQIGKNQKQSKDSLLDNALLKRSYITLRRKFFGPNQEQKILAKLFNNNINNHIAQELFIDYLLDQENFDAAHYWLVKTHDSRQQQPAWQQLAIAFAQNDRQSIQRILETQNNQLTPLNEIAALKRSGKSDKALTLVHNLIEANPNQSNNKQLQQQYNSLLFETARNAKFAWSLKSLGTLDIQQSLFKFSLPVGKSKWAIQAEYNRLDSSDLELTLPANNEVDVSLAGQYPFSYGTLDFKAGSNLRNDASLIYANVKFSHQFSRIIEGTFSLGLNELSYDTAMLRALGAKDKISMGLSAQMTQQLLLQLDIEGHRYNTREGTNLADGYKVNFTLGHNLLMGDPSWQVRLHGAWESNRLEAHLPFELTSTFHSSSATVEDIVTPKYGTLGIGTTFRYGMPEQGFISHPFILADIWTGWVWPDNALAYNLQIAAGLSVFGPDVLSINAFYGNTQGGRTDQAYRGIGIQYEFRF